MTTEPNTSVTSAEDTARFARIALAAWYATGGDPDRRDPTDAWNNLCRMLEDEPDSFPDECRAAGGA